MTVMLEAATKYSAPPDMMMALQITLLVLVAAGATLVVFTRSPVRQVITLSAYGLMLALLFFAFQAPDVALSAIVVGSVALPLMILLALGKVREARPREPRPQEAQP